LTALTGLATGELFRCASPFNLPGNADHARQLPVPISLSSNPQLRGCLLLITQDVVGEQARSAAREAGREIAILLDYEQRARLRTEQVARFRHALIGPVQGLMNQAGALSRLVRRGNATPEELKNIAAHIRSETNAVGLWRDLQRLYSTDEVKVVLRTRALRPIVEGCVERFREPIRVERESTLQLDFRPPGQVDIPIDGPAIDLVLNNLLDNARKYSFAHTTITVTVDVEKTGAWVRVVIEDIGHGIPKRLQDRIYQIGERLDWEDRVRSIDGTGLGLPISRAIVLRHGGRIYHECHEGISVSDPNRCLVRFIVELPTGWR
jgi:signal transduction histidine kinase